MMSDFNRVQLQADVDAKARAGLEKEKGVDELICFTLDNFAYRYLESKNVKNLRSNCIEPSRWRVEGAEFELAEALKAENPITKKKLIAKAKAHAKRDGVTIYPWLEVQLKNNLAICRGGVDWESAGKRETLAIIEEQLKYTDILHLRNRLAKALEHTCEIF